MKIVAFLILFIQPSLAWTPPESFDSTYIEIEEAILEATIRGHYKNADLNLSDDLVKKIFDDKYNLVKPEFDIPKYFRSSVRFWFNIYTQFSSKQVVIHDMENLDLVYNVIDFSDLYSHDNIHKFAKAKIQTQLSLEYTRRLKQIFKRLHSKALNKLNKEEEAIVTAIKKSGLKIPTTKKSKKKFFINLSKNIRTQTGQRNMIYQGIIRSKPYLPFLEEQLQNFRLPKEVLSISFLESSFNIEAKSKVAASGIWQFMPYISNLFMPKITDKVDYRQNPIISSLAAFHLIKENKLNLRRWDLAIPAYNSGPKHLKKALKKLSPRKKKSTIGLDYILTHYKHPHIGFASRNFYSEFLALTRVLAYKDLIYPLKGVKIDYKFKSPHRIGVYVSKCSFIPEKFFNIQEENSPKIRELNYHFLTPKSKYPRGTIVVSDIDLDGKKFHRLTPQQFRKRFPKNFYKFIKGKSCK